MSLALYMEPVKPPEPVYLGKHPVKGIICEAFGEYDGSMKEEFLFGREHLPLLRMLVKLNPEVEELLQIVVAVEQHDVVRVWTDE